MTTAALSAQTSNLKGEIHSEIGFDDSIPALIHTARLDGYGQRRSRFRSVTIAVLRLNPDVVTQKWDVFPTFLG